MQRQNHGFFFNTRNENGYYYNDSDGTVIPADYIKSEKKQLEFNSSARVNLPIEMEAESNMRKIIEDSLPTRCYNQLQLIVTEQCNLRCKYCSYSGIYLYNRTHNENFMDWDIAEKAIRKFHEGFCRVKLRKTGLIPAISFYGGEPLLNFELIRKATTMVHSLFRGKVILNLTTNGTILTTAMLDFFLENDFHLMFSLNGYREEHNRLRTYSDGTGSYDAVWHNMQKIRHKDRQYYQSNCSISAVYDYGTDLRKTYEFFENRKGLLPPDKYRFGIINQGFTKWYSRYSSQDLENFSLSLGYLQDLYIHHINTGKRSSAILRQLCGGGFQRIMSRVQNSTKWRELLPFTGSCFPGSKIAVSPDGTFHCCERINQNFPIGNVEAGLDIGLIADLITQYRNQVYPECYLCPITRLCPLCYAILGTEKGKFEKDPPDICQEQLEAIKSHFSVLWTMFENGVPEQAIINDEFMETDKWYWE